METIKPPTLEKAEIDPLVRERITKIIADSVLPDRDKLSLIQFAIGCYTSGDIKRLDQRIENNQGRVELGRTPGRDGKS